jgi:predicted HTH domain antitoxin
MALGKLQKYAKAASKKEDALLDGLEQYYRGQCSLGYAAKTAGIPVRALMDYMQKHKLPYYSDASDAKEGLKRISEIRSTI